MTPSTSPSEPGGRRGPSLAVIDTPGAPPGWEDARADLIRIVDPLGRAVAWLAPSHRGRCVGLAVRPSGERGTAWLHLFHSADGAASPRGPDEAGCGVQCELVAEDACGAIELGSAWRFVERDPTAAMLAALPESDAPANLRELVGGLRLRFSAALADGTLALDLWAENSATQDLQLRLGLELVLAGAHLRDATGSVQVDLPGSPICPDSADTRVEIPPRAVATVGAAEVPMRVEVELITGVSRLCYLPPGGRNVVSLLASAGEEPGGLLTVEAGGTFHMAVALRTILS